MLVMPPTPSLGTCSFPRLHSYGLSAFLLVPIAGTLPLEWGTFNGNGRHVLRLSSNALTGSLPASWQGLVYGADAVDLARNKLGGAFLPTWWDMVPLAGKMQYILYFNAK